MDMEKSMKNKSTLESTCGFEAAVVAGGGAISTLGGSTFLDSRWDPPSGASKFSRAVGASDETGARGASEFSKAWGAIQLFWAGGASEFSRAGCANSSSFDTFSIGRGMFFF